MTDETRIEGWHFVAGTLRDGSPVPDDGITLHHKEPLEMCVLGYHMSERAIDALRYAPGPTACRVIGGGEIIRDADKVVCAERTILWRVDATDILRAFARACALDVIDLWDAPAIVREYLETGDETKRAAAWAAATDAAWDARAVAGDATRATRAAMDATRAATYARAAAWAARDAAQNTRLEAMLMEAKP